MKREELINWIEKVQGKIWNRNELEKLETDVLMCIHSKYINGQEYGI